ncbi:hypothetical protein ACP70R_021570 [Stipagrostis hirtigluma subsp. patula]
MAASVATAPPPQEHDVPRGPPEPAPSSVSSTIGLGWRRRREPPPVRGAQRWRCSAIAGTASRLCERSRSAAPGGPTSPGSDAPSTTTLAFDHSNKVHTVWADYCSCGHDYYGCHHPADGWRDVSAIKRSSLIASLHKRESCGLSTRASQNCNYQGYITYQGDLHI